MLRSGFIAITIAALCALSSTAQNSTGMPAGNIGIGTASPTHLLQVHNGTAPANTVGSVSEIASFSANNGNAAQFKFVHRRHALNGDWQNNSGRLQYRIDATNQGYLEFNPPGASYGMAIGTLDKELMRWTNDGFVGIGTTSPKETFQIGDRFTFGDGGWKRIAYNCAWDYTASISKRLVAAPFAAMYFTDLGNILFQTAPNGAAGSALTDAVNSLMIHNSGQVGIGTPFSTSTFTDASYKLFVEGGVRARKVKVDQSSWPDYVFEADYPLPALAEIDRFIRENKHLPGMPSAAAVEKDGLDLGDTQAALLKKIEELTLYILEQDKKMTQQQNELNHQQKELQAIRKMVNQLLEKK